MAPSFKLNNGHTMPAIGLGTYEAAPEELETVIANALEAGYRHFDCAHIYGNEAVIGAALKKSKIPREELFITSKLWNTEHKPEDVLPAVELTLKNLQMDYLDLYLIHWPIPFKKGTQELDNSIDLLDTWKAMEKLVESGHVKSIGASNFNISQMERILKEGKIKPVTNQVEYYPYLNQQKLLDFCSQNGILITSYSSLGRSLEPRVLDDPKIVELAQKKRVTPAQAILSWLISKKIIVIPKSSSKARLQQNLKTVELSAEDIRLMDTLDRNIRHGDPMNFWKIKLDFD